MRRAVGIFFGMVLLVSIAPASMAARPGPTQAQIQVQVTTVDVDATCIGTGTPCDGTVELTMVGTINGQSPFTGVKGVRGPQTVVAAFQFPMANYDPSTRCFSGVMSTVQFFVPHGSSERLAFEAESAGGAGCGNGFSAAFTVNSDGSGTRAFMDSTGSGTFSLSGAFDLETPSVSALELDMTGVITLAR